jgi:sulfite exporter TauE/SafE
MKYHITDKMISKLLKYFSLIFLYLGVPTLLFIKSNEYRICCYIISGLFIAIVSLYGLTKIKERRKKYIVSTLIGIMMIAIGLFFVYF